DEHIDMNFGTGALKVTPAHDINDYNIGLKHGLDVIDTLNEDGTLSAAAQIFVGMDRFEARKKVVEKLKNDGLLIKEEVYPTRLGFSQRSHAVVEPRISTQWFVKMKPMAKPALDAVVSGEVRIHPGEKFMATYKYWLENVKDWCISRQLWWGQRIPAWYDTKGNYVVAENESLALEAYQDEYGLLAVHDELVQDEDVLDTWFSSWLWPIEVFKGVTQPGNPEFKYYYPASVLVTGQDIIFFWVARMIMAGLAFENEIPFPEVYFTGMVRDKLGRKMSKSLGNSPDLLMLIDKYGADAVRFGIMISAPAGNDLLFDEAGLEQGRNFNNKLWNALKLVRMWGHRLANPDVKASETNTGLYATEWFENRFSQAKAEITKLFDEFKISEALKNIYSLFWDDFCSWYLEWVKPGFDQKPDSVVYNQTILFFEELLLWLHPFMPFVTEEIYHLLRDRDPDDDLCIKQLAANKSFNVDIIDSGEKLRLFLSAGREYRHNHHLKNSEAITRLRIPKEIFGENEDVYVIIRKQLNISNIEFAEVSTDQTGMQVMPFLSYQLGFEIQQRQDGSILKEELEKELHYYTGFLDSLNKKLTNERFIKNARPEVVDLEKKKKLDTEEKIAAILLALKN
ncbi:MAG: class I tRNA ligase family protein, partial [Bacteroidota bacterium]|nr:class I tRNA ligase family protein [Bacteroidota bacterium]